MKTVLIGVMSLCLAAVGGCALENDQASQPGNGGAQMMSNHAECTVCKKNADLACVDVAVDDKTPRTEHEGKTYYFCSDDCRNEFAKHPTKYAAK